MYSESVPTATALELEGGIFNMVIFLVQNHIENGVEKKLACEKVAVMLEEIAGGLRQQ